MNNRKINILIVHYNTPTLTECLIKSINKYVGANCCIYIFDNSDKYPFTYRQDNITVFDNTKGQIINFDKWLSGYKKKPTIATADKGRRISARHCFTVDKCFDLINDNFILLDSDVLLTSDISELFNEDYVFTGQLEKNTLGITRLLPYCCFINVKLCKSLGVRYYDEKKMHGISMGSGNAYDTGAAFYFHLKEKKYNLINLSDYIVHYKGASWDPNYVNNVKYHVNLTPRDWLNKYIQHYSTEKNKRVVYTCITGKYDKLISPSYVQTDVDYVCFTDNLNQDGGVWKLRPIPSDLSGLDKVKQQRIVKICPHKYLSEYEDSIWVDGSMDILLNVNTFISECCSENDKQVFIRKHPNRTCIYHEAKVCVSMKKDTSEHINKQINRYKQEGFPTNYGLVETNVIYRKHNTEYCKQLMETWANEVKTESHRDQLSFNYALWKCGDSGFKYLNMSVLQGKYFKWYPKHNRQSSIRPIMAKPITPTPKNTLVTKTQNDTGNIMLDNMYTKVKPTTVTRTVKPVPKPKHVVKKTRVFLGTGLNW